MEEEWSMWGGKEERTKGKRRRVLLWSYSDCLEKKGSEPVNWEPTNVRCLQRFIPAAYIFVLQTF